MFALELGDAAAATTANTYTNPSTVLCTAVVVNSALQETLAKTENDRYVSKHDCRCKHTCIVESRKRSENRGLPCVLP